MNPIARLIWAFDNADSDAKVAAAAAVLAVMLVVAVVGVVGMFFVSPWLGLAALALATVALYRHATSLS